MSTIFDELRLDHDSHQRLLDRLSESESDAAERRDLLKRLREELTAHARAEERALYSPMLADASAQGQASHSIKEHEEMESMLDDVAGKDPTGRAWLPAIRALAEFVKHHEDEEEREVFPVAGRAFSDEDKERMADDFRLQKKKEIRSS